VSDDLSIPNPGYRGSRAGRYGTGPSRGRPGMDPDTRRLMMFAGGLGGLLVIMVGASAIVGRHGNEVPVVAADTRPIREKPLKAGGMKIDGAENDVFSGLSDAADAKLAPAAENPDTKSFQAAQSPQAVAPVTEAPMAPSPNVVAKAPPAPVAKPAVVAKAPPAVVAQTTKPAPVKPPAAVAEAHPVANAQPAPAQPALAQPAPAHQAMVQLAALSSEESARNEWQLLSSRMPELLRGHQPNYSRTERDGRTFWRVRTAGFADVAQARTFCEHVRAKGGACSVADF
jgi:hypothetical protein